jgi:hypothetical protein
MARAVAIARAVAGVVAVAVDARAVAGIVDARTMAGRVARAVASVIALRLCRLRLRRLRSQRLVHKARG